ncbi:hypothetical protein BX600DRAFT_418738 [Xylariales sp. PMI_506]|nr:hypothetical protein BX600DRAFT_418738 [Xylariales sp. PMI_506]
MSPFPLRREISTPTATSEPLAGTIGGLVISLLSITILASFLTLRMHAVVAWTKLPLVVWLVFAIYIDSWLFVFITAILKLGVGINISYSMCSSAIFLCLICYVTTKMIYLFLVEKSFIVRNGTKPRLKSKLYIFNSFGMLSIYGIVSILNFIFRITRIDNGVCIIGMQKLAMVPLITFDVIVNVYLTTLFLIPLRQLYSFKDTARTAANERLRTMAMRTFVGAVCTTISSVVNLTVLMALDGEPGWVCLMCCNCDVLFSAVVLQWVTSRDNAGTGGSSGNKSSAAQYHRDSFRGGVLTSNIGADERNHVPLEIYTKRSVKVTTVTESEADTSPLRPTGNESYAQSLAVVQASATSDKSKRMSSNWTARSPPTGIIERDLASMGFRKGSESEGSSLELESSTSRGRE